MTPAPLQLIARCAAGRITGVSARNGRPFAAALLCGHAPERAADMAGALFSLCGVAQRQAVLAACAAARGTARPVDAAAGRAVLLESAQWDLWRLLLDWPAWAGLPPERARFTALHRALGQAADARSAAACGQMVLDFVAEALPGADDGAGSSSVRCEAGGGLVGRILAALPSDASNAAADAPVAGLPPLSAAGFVAALPHDWPDAAFCRSPHLSGRVYETGALARHAGHPFVAGRLARGERIAARLAARVVALAACGRRLRDGVSEADDGVPIDATPLPDGGGLAKVETARGVLLHAVRLDGARVADYAIVAPTEWNFRPLGAFEHEAAACVGLAPDAARRRLEALALALDPCVSFDVRVHTDEEVIHA
ncbi:hypothetical protein G3580_03955 [Nitrogeniibacter mangrovi]|uniref:Hydrogenase n=1 Tax=Nitrogeniibacter mangrovi TaxID=2016596 RepID=A0A6C1AZR6_9RHOO|nr:nickel-dependent hydrogenase large subunit [Nitrogeniibacter mangrovi]QID16861.1 hypothetical protein G3580_03955 [Nitrogeniibacter mangrovi]